MIILCFDTESTGVKSWNTNFIPRLVQLGAILQDTDSGRVLAEINLMTKVVEDIPPGATAVHGITKEMANKFGFSVSDVDSDFAELITMADVLIAHNTPYDLDIMKDNLPLSLLASRAVPTFDTMRASTDVVKVPHTAKQVAFFRDHPEKRDANYKHPNLTETYKHFFGGPFEGAHDAMADIRACRDILLEVRKRGQYVIYNNEIKKVDV